MADEVDLANERLMTEEARAIQAVTSQASKRQINPKGSCHYCGELFEQDSPKLFCDSDCATDYEAEKLARQRRLVIY